MARAASSRSRASITAGRVAAASRPSASASPSGRAGTGGIASRAGSTGASSPRSAASRAAASSSSSVARARSASERAFSALQLQEVALGRPPLGDPLLHRRDHRPEDVAALGEGRDEVPAAHRAEVEARRLEDDRLDLAARRGPGGPRHRGGLVPARRPRPEDGERLRQLGDDVEVGLRVERVRLRAAAPVLHSQPSPPGSAGGAPSRRSRPRRPAVRRTRRRAGRVPAAARRTSSKGRGGGAVAAGSAPRRGRETAAARRRDRASRLIDRASVARNLEARYRTSAFRWGGRRGQRGAGDG